MKRYLFVTFFVVAGCSTSQFTYYAAYEDEEPWRITIEKNPMESFACIINDSTIVEASFSPFLYSYDSFEKDGIYEGMMIKMSGFRTTYTNPNPDGTTSTTTAYQIRIFIDLEQIAIFNF